MDLTDAEMATYRAVRDEMDALSALGSLTAEQADRWATLSGFRLAMYSETDDSWLAKAIQGIGDRWYLVSMPGPASPLRRQAEERMRDH